MQCDEVQCNVAVAVRSGNVAGPHAKVVSFPDCAGYDTSGSRRQKSLTTLEAYYVRMAVFSDCHKLFLQAMMGRGAAKAAEAKDLYKRAAEAYGGKHKI